MYILYDSTSNLLLQLYSYITIGGNYLRPHWLKSLITINLYSTEGFGKPLFFICCSYGSA